MKKEMICIVCPVGCHMSVEKVDETWVITDNQCPRGKTYAITEMTEPKRIIPTTVKIKGSFHERLPVKTDKPILKELIFKVMDELNAVEVQSPVKTGDVVLENVLGTDVNIVATRDM